MKHIIWNQSRGLPTVAHDDLQTALEEAKRLANLQPHDVFEVYSHAATVYGEVKINVDYISSVEQAIKQSNARAQIAAPLSPDVAPVKPDYYPHLRPVPPELLPLPEGAVYLGRGGKFKATPSCEFSGYQTTYGNSWRFDDVWYGVDEQRHYCAPADSEIVRINREGVK